MNDAIGKAFADPVHDAQSCFRAILDAMSHPGRIRAVRGANPPTGLSQAAAAVLLTLVDHDTPLWLDPVLSSARGWIAFHCGSALVSDPGTCGFAVTRGIPDLIAFQAGTHEEPETSTTLICEVSDLGRGQSFRLTGPGLRDPETLSILGPPADFAARWRANHALFPRGVDLILCAGDRLTALPRTVSVQEV